MNKTKKIWSVILLCAEILLAVFVGLLILLGGTLIIEGGDNIDSKAEALGWLMALAAILISVPQLCLFFGALGLTLSIISIKISESGIIKGISIGFVALFSVVLLIGFVVGVCFMVAFI